MTQLAGKPPRADARRNRTRILDAARAQITLHGPEVGMDEIAAAAGVAVGTLYGHFPTKLHLIAAVVSEFLAEVADRSEAAAAAMRDGSPALVELTALLREVVVAASTNQAAKAAAGALNIGEADARDMERMGSALQALIDHARLDDEVRQDLTVDDLYLLVGSVPAGQPSEVLERWIDLVLTGIVRPLQGGAPSASDSSVTYARPLARSAYTGDG